VVDVGYVSADAAYTNLCVARSHIHDKETKVDMSLQHLLNR